jgi:hypothetical protein
MSSAFHPQTDGQTERMNAILEDFLRHYVGPLHDDWDTLLPVAEFAVNNAFNSSVGNTPFFLNYGKHPRTPLMLEMDIPVPAAATMADAIATALSSAKLKLHAAQQRQKAYADRHRKHIEFVPGQYVLLASKNLKFKQPPNRTLARKLLPKFLGPFMVEQMVGKAAVRLSLPPGYRIHPTFHVSLVFPFHSDGSVLPPPVSMLDMSPFRSIEKILDHEVRKKRGGERVRYFLVKWADISSLHNSWEPESTFEDTIAIDEYFRKLQ